MLKSFTVTNFALIEKAQIEFQEGLNIITGETGAGKSILIDALSSVLGGRSSTESIRTGADFYRLEAVFDIDGRGDLQELLDTQGLSTEEDSLIVSRRLSRNGKNAILINGCSVPLNILRQFGECLMDMHGQHENQSLLRPQSHHSLLDNYLPEISPLLSVYQQEYTTWKEADDALAIIHKNTQERAQRVDMLIWQIGEIDKAALKSGEEEILTAEVHRLANAEKLLHAVNQSYQLLNRSGERGEGILGSLAELKKELVFSSSCDTRLENSLTAATEALYQLEEVSATLRDYRENVEFNPELLAQLHERQNLIGNLKRKYGTDIDAILSYSHKAQIELAALNQSEEQQSLLEKKRDESQQHTIRLAEQLTVLRQKAAEEMSKAVSAELRQLGMADAVFSVEIMAQVDYDLRGKDTVAFFFSANPGEDPKALQKIASGGELSRIALALKTVCVGREGGTVMVFDEIDAGIGGQTASMVAEAIAKLAMARQILCITHLPQIASMADQHIYIEKQTVAERTFSGVRPLNDKEQLAELSRMMSGDAQSRLALENASELLANGRAKKKRWQLATT
ncbi:MAG TPA: DNA repair protein RecN [Patescibacteria group bacterium]|nr:DNA repair protein RecN [Patescibacteria group bacterium]